MNSPRPNQTIAALSLEKESPNMSNLVVEAMKQLVEYGYEACQGALFYLRESESGTEQEGSPFQETTNNLVMDDTSERLKEIAHRQSQELERVASLMENEQRMKSAMLDACFDSIVAINESGVIITVNRAALQMFGYSREEMMGQNVSLIVGGNHAENHDSYMKRYHETGVKHFIGSQREVLARRKDGSHFPVTLGIEVVEQEGGGLPFFVASIRDIAQEKKAEELKARMEQEQKTKAAMLDASFDSMFAVNEDSIIQLVNQKAVEQFGYERADELEGQNINIIVGKEHAARHDSYMKAFLRTRKKNFIGSQREVMARRKDGTEFPCIIGIKIVEQEPGKPMFVAFIRDITEEKKGREMKEMMEQEQKTKAAMLDASFDSMFAVNEHSIIQLVNQKAVEQFGYERADELEGHNINIIVGKEHAARHDDYMKAFLRTREKNFIGSQREVMARRKDGTEFPCIIGIKIVEHLPGKPMFVAFLRDITQEKKAREMKEMMEREQRFKAAMLDAAFDSMFAVNQRGIIQLVNRKAIEQFGYECADDMVGNNIHMIVGSAHANRHDAYMKAFHATGKKNFIGSQREVMARRKDGTEFPCIIGIEIVEQEGGKPMFVAYLRDVTEQKRAKELEIEKIEIEKRAAEELLLNMLPHEIADRLKSRPDHIADHFTSASILFADIVGFTALSSKIAPIELVRLLNDLFSRFDDLVDKYSLNKIKTIGDCYMVTSVPGHPDEKVKCTAVCHFALDMMNALKEYNAENPQRPLNLRVGVHTGPVVAGIVGTKRFLYDIWGDAVNLASRMESTGVPGRIQVSKEVVALLSGDKFHFESRGEIDVKGKGRMETYFLTHE